MQIARAEAPVVEEPEMVLPDVPYYKEYALKRVVEVWGIEQWEAFDTIIRKESSWTHNTEHYPSGYTNQGIRSSATGLGGFLDSTWETVGCTKTYDKNKQIDCIIKYIQKRYNTPREALNFHLLNNWY